jgi:peptide/nickel transport system substrate-binding protein
MQRNGYLNVVLTLLLLLAGAVGFVLVRSVDLLRLRAERISEQLGDLHQRLDQVEQRVASLTALPARPARSGATPATPADVGPASIANHGFFDPAAETGDRIIAAIQSETPNMNALINNESFVSDIWGLCYDSLAERNYGNPDVFEPKLAESWELSEDKLVYTVKLREGVLWHDFTDPVSGKEWRDVEVTAEDVKFYLDVIQNPDTDCAPSRTYLKDLDRIEVIDPYRFKVYWRQRYFLSESITLGLQPLPRHLYHAYDGPFDGKRFNDDHERNRVVVGCGPYRFDRWDKGQRIILSTWEKYFGRPLGVAPPITQRVYDVIKLKPTQLQSLRSNQPDAIDMMGLTPEQWVNNTDGPEFGENGHLRKMQYTARSYFYIGYNLSRPLFQDRRIRLALTHLVDRERILKEVYYGLGRIITGPFFVDSPYNDPDVAPYPFDIDKAKALFGEVGWADTDGDGILDKDGKKFEFTILQVTDHPIQQRMLPIIKEDMARAGVVMSIQALEWSVYVKKLEEKDFEVCTLGWRMGYESDPYQIWHSSQADLPASSNHISFRSPAADALIERIRVTFDLEERVRLCREFHRLLHEEQPYTFLFSPDALLALHRRYLNVREFPDGPPTSLFWTPREAQKSLP